MLVDDAIRWRVATPMKDETAKTLLNAMVSSWIRYFGPMEVLVFDQDSAITSEMATSTCDRYIITRKLAGVNSHETVSVVERAIGLCKLTALRRTKRTLNEKS